MSRLLNHLFFGAAAVMRQRFVQRARATEAVQRRFLATFIDDFKGTAQGVDLNLGSVRSIDAFRSRIAARRYDAVEAYAERAFTGEGNVMTPDRPIVFTVSSGTTGARKVIPVTASSRALRNRARQASTGFFATALKKRGGSLGPILMTNGSSLIGVTKNGLPYGMNSACDLYLNAKSYKGRSLLSHPFAVLSISDPATRHYLCLLFALRRPDLKVFTGNFPTYVMQTVNYLHQYAPTLVKDIKRGSISVVGPIDDRLRTLLGNLLIPDPARAETLAGILDRTGTLRPKDVWPNLAAVVTARGAPSKFYFDQFNDLFGDAPVFGGLYGAAEAIYGVYPRFDSDEAALACDNGFYEFVPEKEWNKDFPDTRLAHEVEPGRYRVLVTNRAGLIRYDIGDVVQVIGRFEGAPTFTFLHREGSQLNAVHEMTTQHHIEAAMGKVREHFGIRVEDFMVALGTEKPVPAYHLALEIRGTGPIPTAAVIASAFDQALQDLHEVFRNRRRDTLPAPKAHLLAPGAFARLRAGRTQVPGADTNIKLPRITEERAFLDALETEVLPESASHAA